MRRENRFEHASQHTAEMNAVVTERRDRTALRMGRERRYDVSSPRCRVGETRTIVIRPRSAQRAGHAVTAAATPQYAVASFAADSAATGGGSWSGLPCGTPSPHRGCGDLLHSRARARADSMSWNQYMLSAPRVRARARPLQDSACPSGGSWRRRPRPKHRAVPGRSGTGRPAVR